MRYFIAAVLSFLLSGQLAAEVDTRCRWYQSDAHHIEWVDKGKQHGAQIVSRDTKWALGSLGWHATSALECETCQPNEAAAMVLWFGVNDSAESGVKQESSAEAVAGLMAFFPYYVQGQPQARGDELLVSIDGLVGTARLLMFRRCAVLATSPLQSLEMVVFRCTLFRTLATAVRFLLIPRPLAWRSE